MSIIKCILLVLALTGLPGLHGGEVLGGQLRTWSDPQGRTLQATLVRASGTTMLMHRPDGTPFQIELERFSQADQKRILAWMAENPAALQYQFRLSGTRQPDGSWQIVVVNRGANPLDDLEWMGRLHDGSGVRSMGPARPVRRLEPGQQEIFTLPAAEAGEGRFSAKGIQLRLCRKNAVIWEWSTPGQTAPPWPLEPDLVPVPATGLPPAQILAALAQTGSGSGRLGLPGAVDPAAGKVPAAAEEGEDLVKLFESP